MSDLVDLVERSLASDTASRFRDRVERQATSLREAIDAGRFDNDEFAVGLEMEVYAVAPAQSRSEGWPEQLATLPASAFEGPANKELGVHNAELNTDPNVFEEAGLATQADAIASSLSRARDDARAAGGELVLDAMWTLPPAEGSYEYLAAVDDRDGVTVAKHMQPDPRYVAIDNASLRGGGGSLGFSVPGHDREFPTILFESLASSIQPHLQVPAADRFPAYYNAGIRTLGPVLALSTNSPFLPGDLYAVEDPERLVAETHHELRIAAFEQSVSRTVNPKVRVPRDIETATDVVDRVVEDDLVAPFLREWLDDSARETLAERHWEFDHKRTTYWRWLRCVVGGDPVGTGDERSLRIEYRPLPTQPTVRDVVGLQALVAGLLRGLVAADHPLAELPWEDAERSFYSAVREGPDADIAWVTVDREHTSDPAVIFEEVFAYAREGLAAAGVTDPDRYLAPIEARWEAKTTPSVWKKARVREGLADGLGLEDAIARMQREYVRRSRESASFAEWL
jgi:hypothetical protein